MFLCACLLRVYFWTQYYEWFLNVTNWPMERTVAAYTTPRESRPGSNCDEEYSTFPRFWGFDIKCSLMPYQINSFFGGGVYPSSRDEINVFYDPLTIHTHTHTHIYIYIYIYMEVFISYEMDPLIRSRADWALEPWYSNRSRRRKTLISNLLNSA